MRKLVLIALLALTGCSHYVTMRNAGGMVAQCGPYYRDSIGSNSMALRETECIADFQKQGYQRVSD